MNGFKVNVNKRIWKIVKLIMAEIKKKRKLEFWILNALCSSPFFSFKAQKNIRFLFSLFCVVLGLWCEFFAGNIVLGAPLNLSSFVAVHHHLVTYLTAIKLEAQLESLKSYLDENEDTTLADIIEKIRKLPRSIKIHFSQVVTLLKILLVLAVSERFASTLRRIKTGFD